MSLGVGFPFREIIYGICSLLWAQRLEHLLPLSNCAEVSHETGRAIVVIKTCLAQLSVYTESKEPAAKYSHCLPILL